MRKLAFHARSSQRGLSLIWCAVAMAVLTYGAMAAVFAMRYQRNLLAESWALIQRGPVAKVSGALQAAAGSPSGTVSRDGLRALAGNGATSDGALRKCRVNGKVMYSNVACTEHNRTTHALDLVDSHGIEPPKVAEQPVADTPAVPNPTDRAIARATAATAP